MSERRNRLKIIKKLIKENKIESQEKLLDLLNSHDICVTQATLSRDLKLLKVSRVADANNGYYYTLIEDEAQKVSEERYIKDLNRGFLSINFSGNIAVVRTFSAHANTVAIALDNLEMEDIIGTIAGDDTVLVIMREGLSSSDFLRALRERFPGLDI
jgi:transcriptional regulator of arginine metabolism